MHAATPRSVRIFLPDGNPSGLMIAEVVNWTGKVICAPRPRLIDLLGRKEANRTGVYLLTGPDPDNVSGTKAYIGEADSVGTRLRRHDADEGMDFFDRAAIVVSNDDNLTKAHARFLEARLLRMASEAAHAKLVNSKAPDFTRLPEADLADMESFIEQLVPVLSILGFDLFRAGRHRISGPATEDAPLFVFETMGAVARGRETDEGFVVLSGSTARKQASASFPAGCAALRDQLVRDGKLVGSSGEDHYRFTADTLFASPSAAATIVAARSASGPQEWKISQTGVTYKVWRASQLAKEQVP